MPAILLLTPQIDDPFASRGEGTWRFVSIAGRDVRGGNYNVVVRGPAALAGSDGCNHWSRDPKNPGKRTLVYCSPTPERAAYRCLAMAPDLERRIASMEADGRVEFADGTVMVRTARPKLELF
ncbi:hypothetical protein [Novosphingopyxis sp. YJ-S2-01]|uniref:hypothetical protein n=1 Tax=Novosphingopyxis sp. YJ-S2-01 TaxID=2794021 RepID=UPI0018DB1CA6|nr:hypothetical protein [Novosphingopyxis sp. YJ-S2-01]MBH9538142.1 hypothetical protein [Novosphingopyxis sp. YJ-S2-01]